MIYLHSCRVARLEIFDELEEWVLIQQHYCLVTAVKSGTKAIAELPKSISICVPPINLLSHYFLCFVSKLVKKKQFLCLFFSAKKKTFLLI